MKGFNLAVLALLALEGSQAFVPSNLQRHVPSIRATSMELSAEPDMSVSVPYDAAAQLAYDDWCKTYGKPFDSTRYDVFKENYMAITVMNVSTKKVARESGEASPTLLALNEFADFTAEEYETYMNGETPPATTGDVLGKVVEAAESQSVASNALQEAADALAEEEEQLAAQLGLGSVDELEAAIDAMEGIAEDGSVIEGDNLAREARVRSAYLEWCKEYGKESDETRFQQFFKNFLDMEEYAKESGKEMSLNEYADCTENEYAALMEGEEAVKEAESAIKAAEEELSAKPEISAKQAAEEEARKKKEEAARAKAMEAEAKEDAIRAKVKVAEAAVAKKAQEAAEAKQKAIEEKAKILADKARLASMSDEERRKEIEAQKSARQSAQDKELEKERQEAAAEAIKAAKAAEAAANARMEKQRQLSEEAAEMLRAQARDWEAKQARLSPKASEPAPAPKPAPRAFSFGSILGSPSTKTVAPAPAPRPSLNLGSIFGSSPQAPLAKTEAPKKPVAKPPLTKAPPPAPRPTLSLDFLKPKSPPATKSAPVPKPVVAQVPTPKPAPKPVPVAKAPAPKPAPKPTVVPKTPVPATKQTAPRATMSLTSLFKAPEKASVPEPKPELKMKPIPTIDTSDPVSEAFSSFFGGRKSTPVKKEVTRSPAPVPPKKETPSFSFLSPKPAPKVATPPPPSPATKPAPFSFFSSKPEPKATPAPAPAPKPSFSLFGSKPTPKVQPAPAPAPAPKPFSFFGGSKPVVPQVPKVPEKAPPAVKAAAARPSLSLFGGPKQATSKPTAVSVKATPAAKAVPKDNIPVLSRWRQNADGSLTGLVSNSPSFRNGTEITTSPIRGGAKAGTVVRTGSGSQYRLS